MKRVFTVLIVIITFSPLSAYVQEKKDNQKLKFRATFIAVASIGDSLNSVIPQRFGRAEKFIIYNLKDETFEVIENKHAYSPSGAGTQAAWEIADRKIEAVIGQNFGSKSLDVLMTANIKVFRNVTGTVRDAVENYKKGKLKQAEY